LLGREIRLARKQRKMTEADLASRIGIARSTLQLIEKGQPKVEIGLAFEAAALLGVPLFVDEPIWLLKGDTWSTADGASGWNGPAAMALSLAKTGLEAKHRPQPLPHHPQFR
jgi:transcriptional regulator with XRE-family HTH domain